MEERVDTAQDCNSSTADAVSWFQSIMGLEDWKVEVVDSDTPPSWAAEMDSEGEASLMFSHRVKKIAGVWLVHSVYQKLGLDPLAILFAELDSVIDCDIKNGEETCDDAEEFVHDRRGKLYAAAYRAKVMRAG